MKRAYIRWHIRRYGHEPQWGNGETIQPMRNTPRLTKALTVAVSGGE